MDPVEKKTNMSSDIFWYRAKDDLIDRFLRTLQKQRKIHENASFLSVGPGYNERQLKIIGKYGMIDVIDLDATVIADMDPSLIREKVCSDILGYQTRKKYTGILLFDVLEHIQDQSACLQKLRELLAPDGFVLLTVPAYPFLFSNYDVKLGHYRRYKKKDLRLQSYFDVQRIGHWNMFLFPAFAIGRLTEKALKKEHTFRQFPLILNGLCYKLLSFENSCIEKGIDLPFGLSLYCILKSRR